MARRRRRSAQSFLLEIVVAIVGLIIMLNVVLPWAGRSMAENMQRTIDQQRSARPSTP